ncbi:MAG: hypothetical protein AAGK32_18460, partial [Actinomycetota bacterium]
GRQGGDAPFGDIDGLSTCTDIDLDGQPQCDHPGHGGGDEPETPEVPEAPVDDPVVANPTFTG